MTTSLNNVFKNVKRDAQAGIITGAMAIPLSAGICLMSDYPIRTGLITVVFACIIGFISYLFKPGNYVGVPGVAAGLAPALALGVHSFGMENMAFVIFLTASMQALAWKYELHKYLLRYVPHYLVEGLLAGVGLKIALKFVPFLFDTIHHKISIMDGEFVTIVFLSGISLMLFIFLFRRFSKTSPGIPYFAILIVGILAALFIDLPKVNVDNVPFKLALPIPHFEGMESSAIFFLLAKMVGFSAMLATIDIIEQVMSNVAIEKMDPLKRKCNTKNSLLSIWISNIGASFFGGMTNLDGLAKSTTNTLAGAITKVSNLFVALVVSIFIFFPNLLNFIPEFALGVIMVFTGWKMIAGLKHVIHEGEYQLMLAIICGLLVFQFGIFEGLLIALALNGFIKISKYLTEEQAHKKIYAHILQRVQADTRLNEKEYKEQTHTSMVE
ncbi:SulP family inorganic anion transporter [Catalinimonas sp. 4WD22]|uniref:SulP family inorganic anion transporter n=1 Tax=Catalinimonas locisalis TaxID=3133978 RepID=UPI0031018AD8